MPTKKKAEETAVEPPHDDTPENDVGTDRITVDWPSDLPVEDATLEWSQHDEDLGEDGQPPDVTPVVATPPEPTRPVPHTHDGTTENGG